MDPIAKEFSLDNIQRGNLLSAFIYSYAACHLFIGFVVDRIRNVRWFFPMMLAGWSVSTLLEGCARSATQILWLRILLGVWECVNFPLGLLLIRRIFPAAERSLASGIFASGALLATLSAPPVVIYFSTHYDWRWSFLVAGSLGFLWLGPWFLIFRHPERRTAQWNEVGLAARGRPALAQSDLHGKAKTHTANAQGSVFPGLTAILSAPGFWGVALIGLGLIPSLYFATQWFPSFFTQSLKQPYNQSLALKLSLVYFMQDIGLWTGGALVWWLSQRGWTILQSRRMVITVAFSLMPLVALVPWGPFGQRLRRPALPLRLRHRGGSRKPTYFQTRREPSSGRHGSGAGGRHRNEFHRLRHPARRIHHPKNRQLRPRLPLLGWSGCLCLDNVLSVRETPVVQSRVKS
jgi:ACS family glucarate transporter-like MFS transporter